MSTKNKNFGKMEDMSINIPKSYFVDICERLDKACEENNAKPILIGGRAINLYCFKDTRPTNDMDFVLKLSDATVLENLKNDFTFNSLEVRFNSNGKEFNLLDLETGVKIDLYYSRPINNFPLEHVTKYSITYPIQLNHETHNISIASIPTLVVLKLYTGREKDREDVYHLIKNNYIDLKQFIEDEKTRIEFNDIEKEMMHDFRYSKKEIEKQLNFIINNFDEYKYDTQFVCNIAKKKRFS